MKYSWYMCGACNKYHPLELDRFVKARVLKLCTPESDFADLLDNSQLLTRLKQG